MKKIIFGIATCALFFLIITSASATISKKELSVLFDNYTNESAIEFNETLLFSLDQYNVTYGATSQLWSPIVEPIRMTKENLVSILYDMEQNINPFKRFVAINTTGVKLATANHSTVEKAYDYAASDVIYMSDKFQYGVADKWISGETVISDTPKNNIIKKKAGDCEDKAFLLVSMLRSLGVPPEEVRVGMGKVLVNGATFGHAWVEIYKNGRWLPLESTSGSVYNEQYGIIVHNVPLPYEWFSTYKYPANTIYAYGNDVYFTSFVTNTTNVDWYIDQSLTQRYFESPILYQLILPFVLIGISIGFFWLGLRKVKKR